MTKLGSAVAFGADLPQRFLEEWLGPPTRSAARPQADLPSPLERWHEEVSRWGHDEVMRQNRVPIERQMDGDVLLVGIETQAVWLWGIREGEDNPLVLERENEPGTSWTSTGERLDEFLWHFTLVEAVFGCEFGMAANEVSASQKHDFLEPWAAVGAQPWRWPGPGQALWTLDGALAWTLVNDRPDAAVTDDSSYSVFVAAPSNAHLNHVEAEFITWDWDSRADSAG